MPTTGGTPKRCDQCSHPTSLSSDLARPIEGVDAIIERYQNDWEEFDNQNTIRQIIQDSDQVAMEITAVIEDEESTAEYDMAVVLRWVDKTLVYYRLYVDPIPDM